ncbi:hypothetical protein [Aureimonas sp. D3]|uniref:hypothetical protein n=1 Tax=Aureimonas sp. D3 TaxID=1638164 RepID=UPI0007818E14|nr:hypothetical protein [Aureimonas sp. D3]
MREDGNEAVREALLAELQRQAETSADADDRLTVEPGPDKVVIHGPVDLDDLAMVVMGSLAGGP